MLLGWRISASQWRGRPALNTEDRCRSILLWLFDFNACFLFFSLSLLRRRCRCSTLCCTCISTPAPACQPSKSSQTECTHNDPSKKKNNLPHQRRESKTSKTLSISPQFSLNRCLQSSSPLSEIKRILLHISYFYWLCCLWRPFNSCSYHFICCLHKGDL